MAGPKGPYGNRPRHFRRSGTLVALALIAGAAVAACGGSGGASSTTAHPGNDGASSVVAPTKGAGDGTPPSADDSSTPATAAGFNELVSRGSAIFNHYDGHQSSATFKATYSGVQTATAADNDSDCTQSSPTVTIEQNASDSLAYFPNCAELIATPSTTHFCTWEGSTIQCPAEKGYTNPFITFEQTNLSPSSVLSTLESGSAGQTAPSATYSSATLAGQPSLCMTNAVYRFCVTDAGLLALVQLKVDASDLPSGVPAMLSLTSYRSSAPTSDFHIPAGASIPSHAPTS
jgi:hypothetical protein